jgi:hypothetical protein
MAKTDIFQKVLTLSILMNQVSSINIMAHRMTGVQFPGRGKVLLSILFPFPLDNPSHLSSGYVGISHMSDIQQMSVPTVRYRSGQTVERNCDFC